MDPLSDPLGSYDQWRTAAPDDRLPDCCEEQILGVICEHCNAEEPFRDLCPYIKQLEQENAYEAAWENRAVLIDTIESGRDPGCGMKGTAVPDCDIARDIGIKVDGMTDAEITEALDALLAAPKPVRPSRLFVHEPCAGQVLELVAAIFDHIEKEDD